MTDGQILTGLLVLVSVLIATTSLRRVPGVGIILSLIAIAVCVWLGPLTTAGLGFSWPPNPLRISLWGLALGLIGALISLILLEPAIESLTGQPHNLAIVDSVHGNPAVLVRWVILVWLTVAITEELIFRGLVLNQLVQLLGGTSAAQLAGLAASSILFGIGHTYQGRSGILSTGIIGVFLGALFIWSGYNLVLPILVHGFFDTVHLTLIWLNLDTRLRRLILG